MIDKITNKLVYEITKRIFSGKLLTDQVIGRKEDIIKNYQLTEEEYLLGINELVKKGYLTINNNQEYTVSDIQFCGTLAIIRDQISMGFVNRKMIRSLNEMRMLIEMESIKVAINHCPIEILEKMKELLDQETIFCTPEERVKNEFLFHRMIIVSSGNTIYPLIINTYEICAYKIALDYFKNDDAYLESVKQRKSIYQALVDHHQKEAEKMMFNVLVECELATYKYYNDVLSK